MRFLDLHIECPVCEFQITANEPGQGTSRNCDLQAVLSKKISPYDAFAEYRGSLDCPSCQSRLGVTFRDAIRRYSARTELQSVRVLDPDDGFAEI